MKLIVNDDYSRKEVSAEEVAEVLNDLKADEFVILEAKENWYIQTYLNDDGCFDLEYREESEDQHFSADTDAMDVADVVNIFCAYLNKDAHWKSLCTWELMQFDSDEIADEDILLTIVPDEYHIRFCGKLADATRVMVTPEIIPRYQGGEQTCDFIVAYRWDEDGRFLNAQVAKVGVRGEYENEDAAQLYQDICDSFEGFTSDTIQVYSGSIEYEGVEFGFVPRDNGDEIVVEMMPGNCICFLEPFDGSYDT